MPHGCRHQPRQESTKRGKRNKKRKAKKKRKKNDDDDEQERLRFFRVDDFVSADGKKGIKEAMKGVDVVYHVASPVIPSADDPQKEIVDPAVIGTENVCEACEENKVKRLVHGSSIAGISDSFLLLHLLRFFLGSRLENPVSSFPLFLDSFYFCSFSFVCCFCLFFVFFFLL